MSKKRGIIIIAVGNPYFGRMAYNLVVSVKAAASIPVAVVTDATGLSELSEEQKKLFDIVVPAGKAAGDMDGAMKLRLSLPLLTPFEETLSLDADTVWMPGRDPQEVFDLLQGRDITYVNEGFFDLDKAEAHTPAGYTGWADPQAIGEAYKLKGKLFQMRAEFILFRNTPEIKKAFAAAKKIQAKPAMESRTLAGAVTDEFALNIAFNQAGIEPHLVGWQPTYWPLMRGMHVPEVHKLKDLAYVFSLGGNQVNHSIRSAYKLIVDAAAYQLGLRDTFPLQAKRNQLTERRDA